MVKLTDRPAMTKADEWDVKQQNKQTNDRLTQILIQCISPKHIRLSLMEGFALCKGGNCNIHIWAWFGYFICKQLLRINNLFGPRKRACIS